MLNLLAETQSSFDLPLLGSLWARSLSSSPVIHTLFLIMPAAFQFTCFSLSSNWTWIAIAVVVHLITALIQDAAAVFAFPEDSNCSVQFQQKTSFQTPLVLILVRELLMGILVYRSIWYLEFLKAILTFLLIDIFENNWKPWLHLKHMQNILFSIDYS